MSKMEIILMVLLVASVALHVIAPKTKNKVDDAAAEVIDEVADKLRGQDKK